MSATQQEHPFAPFVRILGKGKTGTRSLQFDEARTAFGMILNGDVEPLQLGAFLMLLRVKEETGEELAGFVRACRDYIASHCSSPLEKPPSTAELDWSSYAGKRAQHPWYLLSALLLARNGVRVLMHGSDGHTPGRAYSEACLVELGIMPAQGIRDAERQLDEAGLSYLPLRSFCRPLDDIMQLKPILGLRSPVNTLARMLNPLSAPYSIQSVFHPGYAPLHLDADRVLGTGNTLVFKGEGGEVELKPNARTRCHLQRGDVHTEIEWPRHQENKPEPVDEPGTEALKALWRGDSSLGPEMQDYGRLAVVETAAAALLLTERAASIDAAQALANDWWQLRDRQGLPC